MTAFRTLVGKHRRITTAVVLALFILLGAASFPIYNFNHDWPRMLTISILAGAIGVYILLGSAEASLLPKSKPYHIIPLNLMLILLSMGCRYILELGEVSNAYNFTIPNMLVHILSALILSTCAWLHGKPGDSAVS